MTEPSSELVGLGDSLDLAIVGEGARFWGVLERREQKKCGSVPRVVMAGLVGGASVSVLWAVLARELTRRPEEFSKSMQAYAGAVVKEVGEILSVLPFQARVAAWQVLSCLLAEGLGIGFAAPVQEARDEQAEAPGRHPGP